VSDATEDDDPDAEFRVREVFAYYGRAAYGASCVEHGLTIALMKAELMSQVAGRARRERKSPSNAEWEGMFDAYMAKHDRLPLGTLIQRFRSVVKPDAALDALLDEALSRRNFLAHGFFRERAVAFAHGAGRLEMIDELERDHDLFIRTDQAVQETVSHVLPKIGVNVERMTAQTEAIIREQLDAARARSAAPKSDA
jgi:hypothetical protein